MAAIDLHCVPTLASALAERPGMNEGLVAPDVEPTDAEAGSHRIDGVVVGTLVGFAESGNPLVELPTTLTGDRRLARSTITLDQSAVGREVVLLFEGGSVENPIITGLIQHPQPVQSTRSDAMQAASERPLWLEVDGEKLTFTAEREIVLRCGEASITLTRAGKILIRGSYILSRSSGAHRIKGASVQIN